MIVNQFKAVLIEAKFKVNYRMERLPLEMIVHIFGYLDFDDLANCRLVCKSFLVATYQVKIEELVLNKLYVASDDILLVNSLLGCNYNGRTRSFWFSTKTPKYNEDPISLKSFLIYKTIFNLENQLKRLHLNHNHLLKNFPFHYFKDIYDFNDNLQDGNLLQVFTANSLQFALNGLRELRQLEIFSLHLSVHEFSKARKEGKCEIELPSLEIFVLDGDLDFIIDLNAPQLRVLQASHMENVCIREPRSVKRIHTTCNPFRLNPFVNLECLFLEIQTRNGDPIRFDRSVDRFRWISDELSDLNSLERLYLTADLKEEINISQLKMHLEDLHHHKTMEKGQEFRIYFQGVELVHFDKIDEYKSQNCGLLKFQIENFDLLQDLPDFEKLNYEMLMKFSENSLPPQFFEKFATIHEVSTSHEPDLRLLLAFLNHLQFLTELTFRCSFKCPGLKKDDFNTFFKQLNAPRLKGLSFGDGKTSFNWELLFKFKELSYLSLGASLELDLVSRLFERLKNLSRLYFEHREVNTYITKKHLFDRFFVNIYARDNDYTKVCFDFVQIRAFCSLVARRRNPVHWIKYIGLIFFRFGLDFLHFNREQTDRLFKFNGYFTWYTDMLIKFIKPDVYEKSFADSVSFYVGPSSELILKEK